jgi:hypothetical protein
MADYYVAPEGSDGNPGSESQPFATLEAARDALRATPPAGDVVVWVRGGEYILSRPLVLGPQDGGDAGRRVTYSAFPGETPVLTAARTLSGWKKTTDYPTHMPEAAKGFIWETTLPEGIDVETSTPVLYFKGQFVPQAMTGSFECKGSNPTTFTYPGDAFKDWDNLKDVDVLDRGAHWTEGFIPIQSVDTATKTVVMQDKAIRGKISFDNEYGTRGVNVPDGLTTPGSWVFDTQKKKIYFRAPGDADPGAETKISFFLEMIRMEGTDEAPIKNVRISGLKFVHNNRMRWVPGREILIGSHEWETMNLDNSAVRVIEGEDIVIDRCTFNYVASSAIRVDADSRRIKITYNTIDHIGGIGVSLLGNRPQKGFVPKRGVNGTEEIEVSFNEIGYAGQIWRFSVGIHMYEVGYSDILSNHIHDLDYSGFVLFGDRKFYGKGTVESGWEAQQWLASDFNRIAHNDIHDFVKTMWDGNGIYLSATGWGNLVEQNKIYNGHRAHSGIRTDNDQWFSTFRYNLIYNFPEGSGIIFKGQNYGYNNVCVDNFFRGNFFLSYADENVGTLLTYNVFYQSNDKVNGTMEGTWAPFISNNRGTKSKLYDIDLDHNLYWLVGNPDRAREVVKTLNTESQDPTHRYGHNPGNPHSEYAVVADPLFVDYENKDFRFKPDSPALKMGIVSLDSVGLLGEVGATAPARELAPLTTTGRPGLMHKGDLLEMDGFGYTIQSVEVCEVSGQVVKQFTDVNQEVFSLNKKEIPIQAGVLKIKTTAGQSISPVVVFH